MARQVGVGYTDAFACIAAAAAFSNLLSTLDREHGIPEAYLHYVANRDDNCVSYASHKYVPVDRANEFMGVSRDWGVYGGWTFKDGSMILALCGSEKYVIIQPEIEGDFACPKLIVDVTDIRVAFSRDDLRWELYSQNGSEAGAE